MSSFQLSLPGFDGPVDALQPMVSARQLSLEELPLASIASQFLAQAEQHGSMDLELAGEVLAAMSRLMLLKSIHLLAQPEVPEDEEPIARRVSADMPALRQVAGLLSTQQGTVIYPSPGNIGLVPRLSRPHKPGLLADAWSHMRRREGNGLISAAVPPFVRLEVAISRLVGRLRARGRVSLSSFLQRANRREVVVHFLGLLELVRGGQATAQQAGTFEEIILEWSDSTHQRRSRAG